MRSLPAAPQGKNQKPNALIVDKEGTVGIALAEAFSAYASTVFVSQVQASSDSPLIHIPFSQTIPAIPDGFYSYMFYVFDIDSKDLLEPLMKKAEEDAIQFFILVPYQEMPLLTEYREGKNIYGHIVVVGDIFESVHSEIDQWLAGIKQSKKIALSGMGLTAWYPVSLQDAVLALVTLCTVSRPEGKQLYLLTPPHPVTQLTLSHALQKSDPLLKVDFFDNEKQTPQSLPQGKHLLEKYDAVQKITTYYQNLSIKKHTEKVSFSIFSKPDGSLVKKKRKGNPFLFILYTVGVFVLMPAFLLLLTGEIGKWLLLSGIDDMKTGAFPLAQQKIRAASSDLSLAQFSLELVDRELSVFGQGKLLDGPTKQLSLAASTTTILEEGALAGEKLKAVFTGKSVRQEQDVTDGANALKATFIALQQLETEGLPLEYQNKLSFINTYASSIETVVENLPQLLGAGGQKKYLVLFQNNTELRPGGGFIGSYGVLTLSRGKFETFSVHDVYEADGQLKGHVEPPFAIRRYLPLVHLYLRDSNFDVDFPKNADKAVFMVKAETGEDVDGVIAIDLSFVKSVIKTVGTIYIPNYNQTVTPDNFFLLTEQHAEKNSFPGSTQKKDFLSSLFFAMKEKLLVGKGFSYEELLTNLLQGIDEKHVLFAVQDPSIQPSFSANGLSSALIDKRENSDNLLNDFLGINEANIGVDKVNYFIKRTVSQNVTISEKGKVKESVVLTLANTSTGTWPGGPYKNYLRFILPKNTTLDTVSINGVDQTLVPAVIDPQFYEAPGFVSPKGLEIEQTEENGKTLFGFLVTVPIASTTRIALSYTLPTTVSFSDTQKYSLLLFKQPGIDGMPYSLTLSYPQGYALLRASQQVKNTPVTLSFAQQIIKDTLLETTFVRK